MTDMLQRAAARTGWARDLQSLVYGDGAAAREAAQDAEDSDEELFRPKGAQASDAVRGVDCDACSNASP